MINIDNPIAPLAEKLPSGAKALSEFKGLSFNEVIEKLANGLVSFAFKLALAVFIFYLGRFIIRKIYRGILNVMTHRHMDASLTTFVLSLVKMVLYFILVITIIGILGIETSSFLALFASAGVAIGMALSGTLQNFAGGVLILILKPYKVGDYIETQGYAGTVKSIQLFSTVINTPDNKTIIIPNGGLSTGTINNYTLESYRRVEWTISLAYDTDLPRAKEVILEMLAEDERVVKRYVEDDARFNEGRELTEMNAAIPERVERKPFVGLSQMADSSINLTVRAWTHSSTYWGLFFDMNERFFNELPGKGFSFPFPQMDVHIN